jgi:thymidylate synthase (FAD)
MPIAIEKIVFAPSVALVGQTVMVNAGVEDAITNMGAEQAADTEGSPLYNLVGRIAGDGEQTYGGNGDDIAEFAGRQCYRSWRTGRDNAEYVANLIEMGHGSVFEHASICFQVTGVSRSLTHELIRHRAGTAYSQESQRYVDAKDLRFVLPPLLANHVEGMTLEEMQVDEEMTEFREACGEALRRYQRLQDRFVKRLAKMEAAGADVKVITSAKKRANEAARSVLPNAAETRLVFTTNLRALRHVLLLRGNEAADLEIRRLAVEILRNSRDYAPNFFADVSAMLGQDRLVSLISTLTAKV